jgi:hypothetical protein
MEQVLQDIEFMKLFNFVCKISLVTIPKKNVDYHEDMDFEG